MRITIAQRISVWLLLFLFSTQLMGWQSLSVLQEKRPPSDTNVIAEFDTYRNGDALMLPVTIEGQWYSFRLDTGLPFCVYDRSLNNHLKGRRFITPAPTFAGNKDATFCASPRATLGELNMRTVEEVALIDLLDLRKYATHPLHGLIGISFLKDKIMRCDFDEGKISFLEKVPEDAGEKIAMPFNPLTRTYSLKVNLSSRRNVTATVDTGWDSIAGIDRDLIKELTQNGSLQDLGEGVFVSFKGLKVTRRVRLNSLSVGTYSHEIV